MKHRIEWRNQYDDARDALERAATDIANNDPSKTLQGPADDCNINTILKRFHLGEIPLPEPLSADYYADVSNLPDLRAILDYQRDAQDHFMALPAPLRARFRNDLREMWDFVTNPDNAQEAISLGILKPPAASPDPTGQPALQPSATTATSSTAHAASPPPTPTPAGGGAPPNPPTTGN